MQNSHPTVICDRAVDIVLETLLSPMDELILLKQLDSELPILHRAQRKSQLLALFRRRSLKIQRGLAEWCYVHFYYIEFKGHLHILRFEPSCQADLTQADVLLSEPDADTVQETEVEGGVSICY
jgi:hypothetical protein